MSTPADLKALQLAFMAGLHRQETIPPFPLRDGPLPAELRWHIYANAYQSRLLECLQQDFEQTWAYAGDEMFASLCRDYLAQHPPRSWTLRELGAHFAPYLVQALPDHPQLGELAEFEWRLRAAFDAADASPLTLAEIQREDAERWPDLRFELIPSADLHLQHFNTLAVWKALKAELPPPAPLYDAQPVSCLIWRSPDRLIRYRSLTAKEATLIRGMTQHQDFATLCLGLSALLPGDTAAFQAGQYLQRWLADGLLGGYRLA
ncbi:HvfC/BufC family peptide modification chaperone [Aeromonas bivalvium]|uniref:HvfC/BufC family peptide modification chaperone n=1 Tax=Aeromonas bivalvium TaxID=440079 RepID=UPI0038D191BB